MNKLAVHGEALQGGMSMKTVFAGLMLAGVAFAADAQNLTLRDLAPFLRSEPRQTSLPLVEARFGRRSAVYADGETLGLWVRAAADGYLTVYSIGPTGDVNRLFPNAFNQNNAVRAEQEIEVPGPGASAQVSGPFGDEWIQIVFASGPPGESSTIVQTKFRLLPASVSSENRPLLVLDSALSRSPTNLAVIVKPAGGYPLPRR
jgi:Domain of unknown function (DUF4384)